MNSADILEQSGVGVEEVKQPKVKKPRSKKKAIGDVNVTAAVEEKVHVKKTKDQKQAVEVVESAQEFDIVLEPSTPDIKNSLAEPKLSPIKDDIQEPITSEYKQISIKLPPPPKTKAKPKKQPIIGEEGDGLIEPIKPKRIYKKKPGQIQEQGAAES
jgi:hypothetical protein